MKKVISFDNASMAKIRKGIVITSFLIMGLCVITLLLGVVPFRNQGMTISAIIHHFFEITFIGEKAFFTCVSSAGYAVLYLVLSIKILVKFIQTVSGDKKWLFREEDRAETRSEVREVIKRACSAVWSVLFLFAMSYIISDFRLGGIATLLLAALVLLTVLVKFFENLIYTNELYDSAIVAVNRGVFLAAIILFPMACENIQAIATIQSVPSFITLLGQEDISKELILRTLITRFIVPIANILLLIYFMRRSISPYSEAGAKNRLIQSCVFFAVILIVLGYANEYRELDEYLIIIRKNMAYIIGSAIAYMGTNYLLPSEEEIHFVSDNGTDDASQDKTSNPTEE